MNALLAICHFCELDGPWTLFCTEAVHPLSPSPPQPGPAFPGERDREADREGEGLTMRANSSATQRADMYEVRCRSLPASHPLIYIYDYIVDQWSHPGFVSVDSERGIRLSCQFCPGREGPIFFGDQQHCHGSHGQDLPHQLLAIPAANHSESTEHSTQVSPMCPQRTLLMNSTFSPAVFPHQRSGNAARSLTSLTQHPKASLHSSFSCNITYDSLIEQEEDMSGWDGAEGGGSNPQPSQSESVQPKDFQFDDGRQDLLGPQFKSLRHLRQMVLHVLMGNQVIWRGADPGLIQSAFNVLKISMLVDVLNVERGCVNPVSDDDILSLYQFNISSGNTQPTEKGPTLLNKIEVALSNENLSVEAVSLCLLCLKEEWMNKVKVLFKFSMVDGRGKEDTQKVLALLGATGPREEDNVCLPKSWMTGLIKLYKSHLITAIRGGERTLSQ
ncbi:folliculin [Carassius gibelio]|uniref:folliculin n=1 Tax=Carassius gibelio TaxID=101364 RepID=UPI002279B606|nr:folliculin [Carassius gibelio]